MLSKRKKPLYILAPHARVGLLHADVIGRPDAVIITDSYQLRGVALTGASILSLTPNELESELLNRGLSVYRLNDEPVRTHRRLACQRQVTPLETDGCHPW